MPVWQSIYEELKGKNLEIISAAQDTGGEAAAGPIFDAAGVTYTAIIDTKHTISTLYNLVNVPSGVMIDEQGRVVRINEGSYAQKHRIGVQFFRQFRVQPLDKPRHVVDPVSRIKLN